jgi:hypothetical protein
MKKMAAVVSIVSLLLVGVNAQAKGREPCSGKKGGISHCSGKKFVCNNGTISASKKTCSRGD